MPDGAMMSAPASAWLMAVRPYSSKVESLSTTSSWTTPQWPWSVYSHRHRSAMIRTSDRERISLIARWVIPSSAHAPLPRASLVLGIPKSSTAGMPRSLAAFASSPISDSGKALTPGMEGISLGLLRFSLTNIG